MKKNRNMPLLNKRVMGAVGVRYFNGGIEISFFVGDPTRAENKPEFGAILRGDVLHEFMRNIIDAYDQVINGSRTTTDKN